MQIEKECDLLTRGEVGRKIEKALPVGLVVQQRVGRHGSLPGSFVANDTQGLCLVQSFPHESGTTPSGPAPDILRAGMKLKLDLHEIYNRGHDIDRALQELIDEAVAKKATLVEIIPGKGSGQLKKHVLRFLDQKEIKALYQRVEKDSHNFGRIFVHFRWK
jgi:hypothetical protein